MDPDLVRHAAQNARANALEARCGFIRGDLRLAPRYLPPEHFHRVVANPPFRKPGSGASCPDQRRARAREETTFSLRDLASTAAALLRFGGSLELVHPPVRLPELFTAFCASGLEPKRLRLIAPFPGSAPRLCLVSASKGGRPGLDILPELVVHEYPGRYTMEVAGTLRPSRPGAPMKVEKPQIDK
jgi:tRNA1Val (adenine37-N6)-methyltransferase